MWTCRVRAWPKPAARTPHFPKTIHCNRAYLHDAEASDWEFVKSFSDDPAERNNSDAPDIT